MISWFEAESHEDFSGLFAAMQRATPYGLLDEVAQCWVCCRRRGDSDQVAAGVACWEWDI